MLQEHNEARANFAVRAKLLALTRLGAVTQIDAAPNALGELSEAGNVVGLLLHADVAIAADERIRKEALACHIRGRIPTRAFHAFKHLRVLAHALSLSCPELHGNLKWRLDARQSSSEAPDLP